MDMPLDARVRWLRNLVIVIIATAGSCIAAYMRFGSGKMDVDAMNFFSISFLFMFVIFYAFMGEPLEHSLRKDMQTRADKKCQK